MRTDRASLICLALGAPCVLTGVYLLAWVASLGWWGLGIFVALGLISRLFYTVGLFIAEVLLGVRFDRVVG